MQNSVSAKVVIVAARIRLSKNIFFSLSIVSILGTFPIDTTKTRLQIQEGRTNIRYNGMLDCGVKIYKQEGFRSLFSGIGPALLRQSVYGTLKFGSYYSLKKFIVDRYYGTDSMQENMWINVSCAALAGAFSSAIANPTDVLKVRLQIQGRGAKQVSLFKCFYEIYHCEGIKGLYRGVVPTSQRAMTIAAVELPVYDWTKDYLLDHFGDRPVNHFVSSFIAALLATIASCPIDVIRTRLMNQRKIFRSYGSTSTVAHSTVYFSNSLECLSSILRNEGFMALYKGECNDLDLCSVSMVA